MHAAWIDRQPRIIAGGSLAHIHEHRIVMQRVDRSDGEKCGRQAGEMA